MSNNFEFNLYHKEKYFGYPNLGSNYLPNLLVEERIARFIRNNSSEDILEKYKRAIQTFIAGNTIVEKAGFLEYSVINQSFELYIDELLTAKNLTVTLISSIDPDTGTLVNDIQQPTFNFNKNTGILSIYLVDQVYSNYNNLFIMTADTISKSVSLVYTFAYTSNT